MAKQHSKKFKENVIQYCNSHQDYGRCILCEEDERMSVVVFRIIKMKLISNKSVINWLNELTECIEWQRDRMQGVARVNSTK